MTVSPTTRPTRPLALAILVLAACGGSDPSGPPPPPTITLAGGGGQSGEVGTALPVPVTVKVTSRGGSPVVGTTVDFTIESGGGLLSRPEVITDAAGLAAVIWTLGGTVGEQRLGASSGGTAITVTASGTPGPPELVTATAGNGQFAVVSRTVPIRPRVQVTDRFGNPLGGVPVVFSVLPGSGTITDSVTTSDAGGGASLGSWTLGRTPGFNRLRASAGQALAEIVAIGIPASVTPIDGQGQSVNAGTSLPIAPAVVALDGDGQPLGGVAISFEVTGGGGSVQGAAQTTNAQGIARVGIWILGLTPGTNGLEARTPGVPSALFQAQGVAAVPAAVAPLSTQAFTGYLGNYLTGAPAIVVTDAKGAPVAGAQVGWEVTGGGALVQRGSPATDYLGRAQLGGWRLGSGDAAQTVRAVVAGLPAATFTAAAAPLPSPSFRIEVRFTGTQPTAGQKAAFDQAAARWAQLILGDLPDIPVSVPASDFGCYPALDETIDDLVIFADIVPIDGVGNVLGQAGPCLIRDDNLLTVVGRMRFDAADVASLESAGRLNDVILHEMGHVIGIGSLWTLQALIQNRGSGDPWFSGLTARAAFLAATGPAGYSGAVVPVENTGGAGTRDVHWRESVATNELMTGFLNPGSNPLSAITVTSLRDQGYVVNDAASDPFSLAAFLRGLESPPLQLREAPLPGPVLTVTRRGAVERAIPRF